MNTPRCALHGLYLKRLPASIGGATLWRCSKCNGPLTLARKPLSTL